MNAEIIGGPHDGRIVPYTGTPRYEPVARRVRVVADPMCIPAYDDLRTRVYDAHRGFDGELFYILRRETRRG